MYRTTKNNNKKRKREREDAAASTSRTSTAEEIDKSDNPNTDGRPMENAHLLTILCHQRMGEPQGLALDATNQKLYVIHRNAQLKRDELLELDLAVSEQEAEGCPITTSQRSSTTDPSRAQETNWKTKRGRRRPRELSTKLQEEHNDNHACRRTEASIRILYECPSNDVLRAVTVSSRGLVWMSRKQNVYEIRPSVTRPSVTRTRGGSAHVSKLPYYELGTTSSLRYTWALLGLSEKPEREPRRRDSAIVEDAPCSPRSPRPLLISAMRNDGSGELNDGSGELTLLVPTSTKTGYEYLRIVSDYQHEPWRATARLLLLLPSATATSESETSYGHARLLQYKALNASTNEEVLYERAPPRTCGDAMSCPHDLCFDVSAWIPETTVLCITRHYDPDVGVQGAITRILLPITGQMVETHVLIPAGVMNQVVAPGDPQAISEGQRRSSSSSSTRWLLRDLWSVVADYCGRSAEQLEVTTIPFQHLYPLGLASVPSGAWLVTCDRTAALWAVTVDPDDPRKIMRVERLFQIKRKSSFISLDEEDESENSSLTSIAVDQVRHLAYVINASNEEICVIRLPDRFFLSPRPTSFCQSHASA